MWAAHDGGHSISMLLLLFSESLFYVLLVALLCYVWPTAHLHLLYIRTIHPSSFHQLFCCLFLSLLMPGSGPGLISSLCSSRCESSSCVTAGSNNSCVFCTAVCSPSPLNLPSAFFSCRLPEEVRGGLWLVSSGYF